MERVEHVDGAVAGSERISTGNKVLSPTELKTDSTEDGQLEDPNKNATDPDGETEIAVGSSHGSHTDDNDSLGYIEDSCDVSNRNCHDFHFAGIPSWEVNYYKLFVLLTSRRVILGKKSSCSGIGERTFGKDFHLDGRIGAGR